MCELKIYVSAERVKTITESPTRKTTREQKFSSIFRTSELFSSDCMRLRSVCSHKIDCINIYYIVLVLFKDHIFSCSAAIQEATVDIYMFPKSQIMHYCAECV